jgi:transcriptional regulator with XRE-family HTH domain
MSEIPSRAGIFERAEVMQIEVLRSFGKCLRAVRTRQGISQELLAERAGLHRTYISGVESGKRNVSMITIYRLSTALGLSVAEFFNCSPFTDVGASRDFPQFLPNQAKPDYSFQC